MKIRKFIPLRVISAAMPIVTSNILFDALLQYLAESCQIEYAYTSVSYAYSEIKNELKEHLNKIPAETSNDAYKALCVIYEIRGMQEALRQLQKWQWMSRIGILNSMSNKEDKTVTLDVMLEMLRKYYEVFAGRDKEDFLKTFRDYIDYFNPR